MFKPFENIIAIDKDDTLNWITLHICNEAGITDSKLVPSLDQIKSNEAPKEFYKARSKVFKDPAVFSLPPYGGARQIVDEAKKYGFIPKICTKIMGNHDDPGAISMHKTNFWKEHFHDIELQIVSGKKTTDAIALVDDSANNCLHFNSRNYRNFLIWSHKHSEETYNRVLTSFYVLNKKLYDNQDQLDFINKNNLFLSFEKNNIKINENIVNSEQYEFFSTQFNADNKLVNIYFKGKLDDKLDFLTIVKESTDKYNINNDFINVLTYNLVNALKI